MYNLYFLDSSRNGKFFYTSGMGFRNDTLFVDKSCGITVISVTKDKDGKYNSLLLKPLREGKRYNFIINHSQIKSETKKSKARYKVVPAKAGKGTGSQDIQGDLE